MKERRLAMIMGAMGMVVAMFGMLGWYLYQDIGTQAVQLANPVAAECNSGHAGPQLIGSGACGVADDVRQDSDGAPAQPVDPSILTRAVPGPRGPAVPGPAIPGPPVPGPTVALPPNVVLPPSGTVTVAPQPGTVTVAAPPPVTQFETVTLAAPPPVTETATETQTVVETRTETQMATQTVTETSVTTAEPPPVTETPPPVTETTTETAPPVTETTTETATETVTPEEPPPSSLLGRLLAMLI